MKYPLTDQDHEILENSYMYHPPKEDQPERYAEIRATALQFAKLIHENCPPSRERSIALTNLELVTAMANKSIACNE